MTDPLPPGHGRAHTVKPGERFYWPPGSELVVECASVGFGLGVVAIWCKDGQVLELPPDTVLQAERKQACAK